MKPIDKTLKYFLAGILLLGFTNAYSQEYNTAIGIRGGGTSGITVKHFTASGSAIEGILGLGPHHLSITGLLEKHKPAFDAEGLNWYYGAGAHVSFYDDRWGYDYCYRGVCRDYNNGDLGLGVDGIVGLEYKIPPIPIAVSLDLKPYIEVTTNGGVGFEPDPGLGVKFAF